MSKKRESVFFCFALSLLFLISVVSAATNTTNSSSTTSNLGTFDKSYTCLKDQVNSKISSGMTVEELAFSLMALGYDNSMQSKIKSELESQKSPSAECWPKGSCTIKETALVLLAYNHINQNTDKIESWLMNQTQPTPDLTWYLEIDSTNKTECTVSYDSYSAKVKVTEDKKITGNAGTCLRSGYNGFWLEVVPLCYGKDIEISCDNDFLTTLIYKKKTGLTYYVSSSTQTAAPNGQTTEKVESLCFKQASSCNYEGSLWATLALQKKSKDTKAYMPYLITLSSDNQRFFPSAFLYSLTGFDEYLSDIASSQNKLGYWQISETSRRYYDTAIGLLNLYGRSSEQGELAKEYLLQPSVQGNGCWNNNLRDTAFLLYSMEAKPASSSGIAPRSQCQDFSGYSCMFSSECENINGSSLPNFACSGTLICCDKVKPEKTCTEQSGEICSSDEECSGDLVTAKGTTSCCLSGECKIKSEPQTNDCEDTGFSCSLSCSDTQEEKSYSCENTNDVCCAEKSTPTKSYWWVWLLVILIILIVLAIIFRDQLKIWGFKMKSKFSKSSGGMSPDQRRPPFPPSSSSPQQMQMMPRRIIPGMQRPPMPMQSRPLPPGARPMPRPSPFPKDRELDETMKKLKDMSK